MEVHLKGADLQFFEMSLTQLRNCCMPVQLDMRVKTYALIMVPSV